MRIIMEIPNQSFDFLVVNGTQTFRFNTVQRGTILLVAGVYEDDDDAIAFFGRPDGEEKAQLAFWQHSKPFLDAYNEMLRQKRILSGEREADE